MRGAKTSSADNLKKRDSTDLARSRAHRGASAASSQRFHPIRQSMKNLRMLSGLVKHHCSSLRKVTCPCRNACAEKGLIVFVVASDPSSGVEQKYGLSCRSVAAYKYDLS